MQVPIVFEHHNGSVDAVTGFFPGVRATGKTREEAEDRLRRDLQARARLGDVKYIDLDVQSPPDAMAFTGAFRDDPTLREIAEETYRMRAEEKAAEFPE